MICRTSWTRSANWPPRCADRDIRELNQRRACLAGERNRLHPQPARGRCRIEDAGARAAGAQRHQAVAGAAVRLDIARKHVVVAVVVGDTGHVAGIADRDGGERLAIFPVAAGQFLGEVHRVAQRAAVAAGIDAAAAGKACGQQRGGALDVVQRGAIGDQCVQRRRRFGETRFDVLDHRDLSLVRGLRQSITLAQQRPRALTALT